MEGGADFVDGDNADARLSLWEGWSALGGFGGHPPRSVQGWRTGRPKELRRGPQVEYLCLSPLATWSYQPLSTYSVSCTYHDKRDLRALAGNAEPTLFKRLLICLPEIRFSLSP